MVDPKVSVSVGSISVSRHTNFSEQVVLFLEGTRKDTDNDDLFLLPHKIFFIFSIISIITVFFKYINTFKTYN